MASPSLHHAPISVHSSNDPLAKEILRTGAQSSHMHQMWQRGATAISFVADALATLTGILAGYQVYRLLPFGAHLRYDVSHLSVILVSGASVLLAIFQWQGLYRCRGSLLHVREFEIILRSIAIAMVGAAALSALVHAVEVPRLLFVVCLPSLTVALVAERLLLYRFWPRLRHARSLVSQSLIIGSTETGMRLFHKLAQSPQYGIHVAGFIATRSAGATVYFAPSYDTDRQRAEVIGHVGQIDSILSVRDDIDSLIIADDLAPALRAQVEAATRKHRLVLRFVPHPSGFYSHWMEYSDIDGIPLGTYRIPGRAMLTTRVLKRLLDVVAAGVLLTLLSPLILSLAMLIWMDSFGPVIFRQARVGLDGQIFTMFKFRTMHTDACGDALSPQSAGDPRLTRCGRWLRRLSLDEVPQLLNVLRGEMSLVGPRPEMPFVVAGYSELERERLRAKPGITGLWQISADRGRPIHENIEYDLYYLEHQSVFLDLAILLNTAIFVVRGIGAW